MQVPSWLDETAKFFWHRHYKALNLDDKHAEGFALLCQCYADYRHADDIRMKKLALDYYLKLAKEYNLTPKSLPKKVDKAQHKGDLSRFIVAAKARGNGPVDTK